MVGVLMQLSLYAVGVLMQLVFYSRSVTTDN